jgi:hypothetical protein
MTVRTSLAALACGAALAAGCAAKPAGIAAPGAEPRNAAPAETARTEAVRPEPPAREPAQAPSCSAPPAGEGAADAETLVRQLGDSDYGRREAAQKALAAMGEKALPAVERGAASGDFEIAARCEELARKLQAADEPEPPEMPEGLRAAFRQAWVSVWRGGHGPGTSGPAIRIEGPGIQMGPVTRTGGDSQTVSNSSGRLTITVGSDGAITVTIQPTGKEAKTASYRADSREEFERKYPRFSAKYLK